MIVTGASSGIGEALCRELAGRGRDLILVARNERRLEAFKEELEAHFPIKAVVLPWDLSEPHRLQDFHQACSAYLIAGLINNAGAGLFGTVAELEWEAERALLDLNVTSVHLLSKLFLKDFTARGWGMLLNVASTAAFQSGPYMAGYYAGKAYVLSLTEGMAEEAADAAPAVKVSVLCPGPVATGFHQRTGLASLKGSHPSAKEVAIIGLDQWAKGRVLIVPGFKNRFLLFFNRLIPRKWGRKLVKINQLKKVSLIVEKNEKNAKKDLK